MNIRLRLTLWYTAVFSTILVIFSLVVYVGLTRSLLNTVDNHLQREVGEILGNLEFEVADDDEHNVNLNGPNVELSYIPEEGVYWRVLDEQGRSLIDPGHFVDAVFSANLANRDFATLEYAQLADGTPVRLFTTPFVIEQRGAGLVQVAESYRHIQEVQGQLIALLLIGIPLTLLASSAGGWFLAASALNPIDRITRAARQISARDLHQRLNLALPSDEVGRLAATFDQMLERLDNAFEQQKRFIADASHEMKTPLTILKGDVEVALARPRSAESYRDTLENVNQTTDQLIALVQELLLLARSDGQPLPLNPERINLPDLLTRQASALMPTAVGKDIALHLNIPDTLLLEGDPNKLNRLFMNLIDNAIKYSGPGDSVTVSAVTHGSLAQVTIADTGPGIDPKHLPHLFERFYRVDRARSRVSANGQTSGAGLGLSIVKWLAEAHGGRIEVSSQPGEGTCFTVWLPLRQPTPLKTEVHS
ncbi:MAG: ATP-binding protein [Anaerolineae bacterium]